MLLENSQNSKKYQIILADPPWSYKVWSKKGMGRSAEHHYPTMNKKDIQKLPIQDICTDDCVLFLWVIAPCLLEGIELIKSWGSTSHFNCTYYFTCHLTPHSSLTLLKLI